MTLSDKEKSFVYESFFNKEFNKIISMKMSIEDKTIFFNTVYEGNNEFLTYSNQKIDQFYLKLLSDLNLDILGIFGRNDKLDGPLLTIRLKHVESKSGKKGIVRQ